MVEVRVWNTLELLQSGVSLECFTESHQALHPASIADVVASEAAVGGVGWSVAADDCWTNIWGCMQSECNTLEVLGCSVGTDQN